MCQATVVRVSMLFFKACPEGVFAPRKLHLRPWYLFVLSEVVEHPSLFPARHLRPFRTTLHLSHERDRWRVVLTLTLLWPSCLSSYLILLSLAPALYTPFPGRPGLFRSSFAFWWPGQCNTGDVFKRSHDPASHRFSSRTSLMFFYPRGCNLSSD